MMRHFTATKICHYVDTNLILQCRSFKGVIVIVVLAKSCKVYIPVHRGDSRHITYLFLRHVIVHVDSRPHQTWPPNKHVHHVYFDFFIITVMYCEKMKCATKYKKLP